MFGLLRKAHIGNKKILLKKRMNFYWIGYFKKCSVNLDEKTKHCMNSDGLDIWKQSVL